MQSRLDFESLVGILLSLKLGLDIDDDGAEPVPLGIKEPRPIRAEPDPFHLLTVNYKILTEIFETLYTTIKFVLSRSSSCHAVFFDF